MKDVRIRISTAAILSFSAFLSVTGAVAVLVWWLLFTPRHKALAHILVIASFAALIAVVAGILQATAGTGISYGIRMGAVLLVAMWLWSERQQGEFLSLGVWLFGHRLGFEAGMTAELGMQAFDAVLSDLGQLKIAWALKGMQLEPGNLATAGTIMVNGALARAQDTAELLAVRGYRRGGSLCPSFNPVPADILGCIAAILAGSVAILPVGAFFILP